MIDEMLKQKRARRPKNFAEMSAAGTNGKPNGNGNGNGENGEELDVPEDIENFEVENESITKGR